MSTFGVDNYTSRDGSTGSVSALTVVQGTAKAWWNLNGVGTIAVRDDFNVASYTDNGTGDYTATFSTARPNANYCPTAMTENDGSGGGGSTAITVRLDPSFPPTTTALRHTTHANTGLNDRPRIMVSLMGDPH